MIQQIDINCDMGEQFGIDQSNNDEQIMPFVSSCNIACGYHSGSPEIIKKTIELAIKNKVEIGAHPSYKDRENFGRVSINLTRKELQLQIIDQLGIFLHLLEPYGEPLHHIKMHGALYNNMSKSEEISFTVLEVIKNLFPNIKIYGQAASEVEKVCKTLNLKFVSEVFADRRYDTRNRLRSRSFDDALIRNLDQLAEHLDHLIMNQVKDKDDNIHQIYSQTLCIHGDTDQAVSFSKFIHTYVTEKAIEITAH